MQVLTLVTVSASGLLPNTEKALTKLLPPYQASSDIFSNLFHTLHSHLSSSIHQLLSSNLCSSPQIRANLNTEIIKTTIKHVEDTVYTVVYADDLAMSCHGAESLQSCLDDLQVYCANNLLKVNVSTSSSHA